CGPCGRSCLCLGELLGLRLGIRCDVGRDRWVIRLGVYADVVLGDQLVGLGVELRQQTAERERRAWPERDVAPVVVEVPARTAARAPHRPLPAPLDVV